MKIKIEVTLDVDRNKWELNYGGFETLAAFRADVHAHVEGSMREHFGPWSLDVLVDEPDGA